MEPGDRFTFYKLIDSTLPPTTDKDGHEKDFFDGIDTTLSGWSSGFDATGAKELTQIEARVAEAAKAAENDPGSAAAPLSSVVESLSDLEDHIRATDQKQGLVMRLREKEQQARTALNLALNLSLAGLADFAAGFDHTAQRPDKIRWPRFHPDRSSPSA